MATFALELANSFNERWTEVNVLLNHAEQDSVFNNRVLYDAICRATVLLTVSQLEAFIKDLAKAIIRDFNAQSNFLNSPMSLKRTFCRDYIDNENENKKENEVRFQKLVALLNPLNPNFVPESFLVEGDYDYKKNPSPTVISRICSNFGVRNVFLWLESDRFGEAFSGTQPEVKQLGDALHAKLLDCVKTFPYQININELGLNEPTGQGKGSSRTMWQTFLDDILKNRNDIAHGSQLVNGLSLSELVGYRNKVTILEFGIMAVICHKVCVATES